MAFAKKHFVDEKARKKKIQATQSSQKYGWKRVQAKKKSLTNYSASTSGISPAKKKVSPLKSIGSNNPTIANLLKKRKRLGIIGGR